MLQIVNVTFHFLEHSPLLASPFLVFSFPTRHMTTGQRMRAGTRGQSGQEFFLPMSSPGLLAFFSTRLRGSVYLLVPVWKHFTPSLARSERG